MNRQRNRDRGIEVRTRHAGRHVTAHRHRESPGNVDRQRRARRAAAQYGLRDDADAKHDQDKGPQELGQQFAFHGRSL